MWFLGGPWPNLSIYVSEAQTHVWSKDKQRVSLWLEIFFQGSFKMVGGDSDEKEVVKYLKFLICATNMRMVSVS